MTESGQRPPRSIDRGNSAALWLPSLLLSMSCSVAMSARADPTPPTRGSRFVEIVSDAAVVSECARLRASTQSDVEGLLSTFYEDGAYRFAVTHVAFTRFPHGFFADDAAYLVFKIWTQAATGERLLRTRPARLFLYERTRGLILRHAPLERVSRSGIEAAIALSRLDPAAYPLDTALSTFSVLLSDIDETWSGVTVEGHTAASGTRPAFAIEAAIPPYAANPGTDPEVPAAICAGFDRVVKHQRAVYREVDRPYLRQRPAAVQAHP